MSFQHFVQNCEMSFWKFLTPVLGKKGPILKLKSFTTLLHQDKGKYLVFLVIIWGSVGFITGLLIGKLMDLFLVT